MDGRQHRRDALTLSATLVVGGESLACETGDISVGGAKVRLAPRGARATLAVGLPATLVVDPLGELPGTTAWVRGETVGLVFSDAPEHVAELLTAMAMHGGARA